MLKRIALSVLVALFALTLGTMPREARAAGSKIKVCHVPPGNPENAHTISVSAEALEAHLAHGDTVGACGGGDPE